LSLVQELVHLHGGAIAAEYAGSRQYLQRAAADSNSTCLIAKVQADRLDVSGVQPSAPLGARSYVQEALGWLKRINLREHPCS